MLQPRLITFPEIGEPAEGFIATTQSADLLPFEVRRVFWTYGTPQNVVRGRHAHRQTEQVLVAISGRIIIEAEQGPQKQEFILDNPTKGLYLPPLWWTRIYFSENAVLLSLTSTNFEEADYIRNYDEFCRLTR